MHHESIRCGEAHPHLDTNDVSSLTLFQTPFELQQEVKIPKLATVIRERGVWPRYRPLAVFWAPAGAKDRSLEFNASSRDTLLGGITARIKLGDGSHLDVVDKSDLVDFIRHHAWFEGVEVALPREDRLCLLGHLTSRSPKRRRNAKSRLDPVASDVVVSFPVETEQHELDPEGTGANDWNQTRWQLTTKTAMTILRAPGSL